MNRRNLVALKDAPSCYPYLTERGLRYWVAEGLIRYYKVGSRVFFDREDLDALPTEVPAISDRRLATT